MLRKSQFILTLAIALLVITTPLFAADAAAPAASGTVNINTADVKQLTMLPRVGEKSAQRIVDYRTQNGPFKKPSDLMQVKGFGAKSFELLSPYVSVEGKTTLTSKVKGPGRPRKAASKPSSQASE